VNLNSIQVTMACVPADEEEKAEESKGGVKESEKYGTFWGQFGKAIKLGVIEDTANRQRLAKLLRFKTSKSPDKLTSLDDYISRMKEGQKQIYYLTGRLAELCTIM
jgi:heat shock protein 90kDa beta